MACIDIVALPRDLEPRHLDGRVVIVLDVLRATTTIVSALANGASAVRVFGSIDEARSAAARFDGLRLLAGETNCLPSAGFDLGNSPGDFTRDRVAGMTIFMSTTNGTKAILAARKARRVFAAALVNAAAMAKALNRIGGDVTFLCAGTNGAPADEDMLAAELIARQMNGWIEPPPELVNILRRTAGGRNVLDAGLAADIDFAARLNVLDLVVEIEPDPPTARVMHE